MEIPIVRKAARTGPDSKLDPHAKRTQRCALMLTLSTRTPTQRIRCHKGSKRSTNPVLRPRGSEGHSERDAKLLGHRDAAEVVLVRPQPLTAGRCAERSSAAIDAHGELKIEPKRSIDTMSHGITMPRCAPMPAGLA